MIISSFAKWRGLRDIEPNAEIDGAGDLASVCIVERLVGLNRIGLDGKESRERGEVNPASPSVRHVKRSALDVLSVTAGRAGP